MRCIDAFAVGQQCLARSGRQAGQVRLGSLHDAQRAHEFVGAQRGGAQDFGQLTAHQAAVKFHLPATLLRVHKTQRPPSVLRIGGLDVHHVSAIAADLHRSLQAR